MPKEYIPKVITASDLLEGNVIYLTGDDRWSRRLGDAEIITDEAHAQLRLLDAERQSDRVVGPYLADVNIGAGEARPVHFREAIRHTGPGTPVPSEQGRDRHV